MTPEGKVKKALRAVLKELEPEGLHHYWPVPGGYGAVTLDVIVCYRGRFIGIETKAPGKHPTARQEATIDDMVAAGASVIVIDNEDQEWVRNVLASIRDSSAAQEGRVYRTNPRKRR